MKQKGRRKVTDWNMKKAYSPAKRSEIPKLSKRQIQHCAVIRPNFNLRRSRRGA